MKLRALNGSGLLDEREISAETVLLVPLVPGRRVGEDTIIAGVGNLGAETLLVPLADLLRLNDPEPSDPASDPPPETPAHDEEPQAAASVPDRDTVTGRWGRS